MSIIKHRCTGHVQIIGLVLLDNTVPLSTVSLPPACTQLISGGVLPPTDLNHGDGVPPILPGLPVHLFSSLVMCPWSACLESFPHVDSVLVSSQALSPGDVQAEHGGAAGRACGLHGGVDLVGGDLTSSTFPP